jgi:predicted permease
VSRLDLDDIREASPSYQGVSAVLGAPMNVSDEGLAAEQFDGTYVSANLFQLLRQRPMLGRDFRQEDDRVGAEPVVLIGNAVWQNRYGGDPSVLGRVIKVNSLPCTVIGVMAPGMQFPFNAQIWLPFAQLPPEAREPKRDMRNLLGLARLTDGATLAQAQAELATINQRLSQSYAATNKDFRVTVTSFAERVTGRELKLMFWSLMGAVAFVLLIACANVANLLLARAAQRSKEIAVRVSLGASRWRIVRQLLIESVLLATVSGVLGLIVAVAGIKWFDSVTSQVGKPYWMVFTLDTIVFVFLAAVCVATGIIFGLAPALHVSRTDVNEVLKDAGGRSAAGGVRARRWTGALIVTEVALTLVLLAGAGYMLRSFLVLYNMDVGVDTGRLVTMRIFLPLTKYRTAEPRATLARQIEERLKGVSALQASALTTNPPLFGGFLRQLTIDGRDEQPDRRPEVTLVGITAGYFETLGVRPLRGRTFSAIDGTAGHDSAIVNQQFAAMHFPGQDPLDHRITLIDGVASMQPSPPKTATIVGIVPTVRQRSLQNRDPDPVVYLPYVADPQRNLTLIVRSSDAGRATTIVREEMRAVEPDLPLFGIQTLDQLLAQQRWPFRVFGSMLATFALIALILSAVGLYAVTAYSVNQRTAEIGVRMALGAQPPQVMWLVLRRALLQLAVALPIGLAGAFGVGRLLRSLLISGGSDPLTVVGIVVLMILVSLAAAIWPARRATRLDPVAALRYE